MHHVIKSLGRYGHLHAKAPHIFCLWFLLHWYLLHCWQCPAMQWIEGIYSHSIDTKEILTAALSLRCLVPWINHLPPVCWSTFGILVWNDSGYVNLTQWWYFFIIFEYILHISTPHIMIFCFPLPYFPLSTSALFFAYYSCTHIVYRRSLVTFYWNNLKAKHISYGFIPR